MPKRKSAFRPTRAYPEGTKETVIECIANGLTDKDTAEKLGLSSGTIGLWKRSDPAFRSEYGIAKLSLKEKYLRVVLYMAEHGASDSVRLRAATWYLERKHPEEYAAHQVIHAPKERSPLDIMLAEAVDTTDGVGVDATDDADATDGEETPDEAEA